MTDEVQKIQSRSAVAAGSQPRVLYAITVELCAKTYLAVCVWPDDPPAKPACWLMPPNTSWLEVKAGDKVLMKQDRKGTKGFMWVERVVKKVVLYRVAPVVYEGRIVVSGRDWLNGDNGSIQPRK